jgi:glutathione S-transferase
LIDAFTLKTEACLTQLDDEAQALAELPLSIGHVAIGCALGYADYRFGSLDWRRSAPRLAEWFADLGRRPSFVATEPAEG